MKGGARALLRVGAGGIALGASVRLATTLGQVLEHGVMLDRMAPAAQDGRRLAVALGASQRVPELDRGAIGALRVVAGA